MGAGKSTHNTTKKARGHHNAMFLQGAESVHGDPSEETVDFYSRCWHRDGRLISQEHHLRGKTLFVMGMARRTRDGDGSSRAHELLPAESLVLTDL